MKAKQKILVILLFALFLSGCGQKERELEKFSFLTTDIDGNGQQVSRFSGTLISKKRSSDLGEVSLAVKMRSDQGKTIEFLIVNYKEHKIYPLVDTPIMYDQKYLGVSSGVSRMCLTGRFFFNSGQHDIPSNDLEDGRLYNFY